MGKIIVGLDKTNPYMYIIHISTNEGAEVTFKVDDKEFHSFIEKLKTQKHIAEMNRQRCFYETDMERWK